MRILGVDPGLSVMGYGVIAVSPDGLQFVAAGTIRPPHRQSMAQRLHELYNGLKQVITTHQPACMALESLYTHHQYLTTAALMAHARGVACLLSAQYRLLLIVYSPTRVKKALTDYGTASKEQVSRAVGMWLKIDTRTWASDVTDALALAIAHAQINSAKQNLLQGSSHVHKFHEVKFR
jgi:crossover junction endodeoxyribonuclease RuvC